MMIPNPDKSDETNPDLMLTFPQSDYYSISKMNNVLINAGPKALSMLHCNIRSLPKNMTLLDDMLCSIDKRPDILSITETKLNSNTITNVDLPNYNFYHTDSPTPAGGAAIYIKRTLKSIPRPDIILNIKLVETCWAEIDPCNGKKHILVGCIYRHPSANVDEFKASLEETIKMNSDKY